ncbi:MAG TPA: NADH-quinone oxidoreductase subunit C [Alphaproteobacteria bacterium]|nr:NADH-quinone oxidoreductase subunit C [Alphaproteobacteria bacterium]
MADLNTLEDNLRSEFGPAVIAAQQMLGELTLIVSPDVLSRLMVFLRDNPKCRFTTLIDICGADYPSRAERFEVVYHLLSMHLNHRLRIKVRVGEGQVIDSVVPVWPAANWYEREAFDMYGIEFRNHPDLRRILTDYGFTGHPLRKDFPLTGYVEVRYDEEQKRVVYEPVKLTQEFRKFDFMSPWEGAQYVLPGDEKAAKPAGAAKP